MEFESFCYITCLSSFKHFYFFLLCHVLIISVPVTSVTMTQTPIIALFGQQINITCTTSYCYPPANITWYMSSTDITSRSTSSNDKTEGLVLTVSSLSLTLGNSDNEKHVFCKASNIPDQIVTSMVNTVTVLCMYPLQLFIKQVAKINRLLREQRMLYTICGSI